MEGFWSLLRSWLCPHRGVSKEKLLLDLGFVEYVYDVRRRGKALLGALIELLVTPTPRNAGGAILSLLARSQDTNRGCKRFYEWAMQDSNLRLSACKADALPTELIAPSSQCTPV